MSIFIQSQAVVVPLLLLHAASGEVHGLHHGSGGQAPPQEVHRGILAVRPSAQALCQGLVGECFNCPPLGFCTNFQLFKVVFPWRRMQSQD